MRITTPKMRVSQAGNICTPRTLYGYHFYSSWGRVGKKFSWESGQRTDPVDCGVPRRTKDEDISLAMAGPDSGAACKWISRGHVRGPGRPVAGRDFSDFLLPLSFGNDGVPVLLHQFSRLHCVPDLSPLEPGAGDEGGRLCAGECGDGRRLLHGCADHRTTVGETGVGYLVDLGCAADDDAGALPDLCGVSIAAALCGGSGNAHAGGGDGDLRLCGC